MNWNQVAGIKPVNIFHLITNSDSEEDIAAAIDEAMVTAGSGLFEMVNEDFLLDTWTITLLDGHSAGQTIPVDSTIGGQATGNPVPQVAGVLSMHTPQRGPRGRGRMYLGPVGEGVIVSGLIDESVVNSCTSAWESFRAQIAATDITGSLGVASYVHEEVNGVTSVSMRRVTGTQRRRNDRLV